MKKTKRLLALLTAVILILTVFAGCGSSRGDNDDDDDDDGFSSSGSSDRETEPQKVAMAVICACLEGDNRTAAKYLPHKVSASDVGWDEPDEKAGKDRGNRSFYPLKGNGTEYTGDDLEDYLSDNSLTINGNEISDLIDISDITELRTYGFVVRFEDSQDDYYCETCSGLIDGVWYVVSYTSLWN